MTTRIKILPEQLTNKIAAGEVVERPASVVKELLENAIDAGCSDIVVEIEGGGKRLIRISDNGCGMSREDALLALERHATSKIRSDDDLFNLMTLGFRGEALPSIASVSRFTLATREEAHIEGTEIYAEGGRIREVKACGMATGTVVTVRNLFFNTPARLKFMKSNETETGHVADLLVRLAISRPDVRFTYLNDGKTVFRLPNSDLKSRVSALLGKATAATLHPVECLDGAVKVHGLVAGPDSSRSSSSSIYTYINSRYIRDRVVQHAVVQAYRNVLERGRFPVAVLFIEVPSDEVDVNVHPTKHEVRFREQGRVHDFISNSVESVLRDSPWRKSVTAAAAPFILPSGSEQASSRIAEVRESLSVYQAALPRVAPVRLEPVRTCEQPVNRQVEPETEETGYFSSLTIIGQLNAAYILCQDGSDLLMIDQHAAHERVAFELLRQQYSASAVESQGLLFAETADLNPRESAVLQENADTMKRLGYQIEHFGGCTWLIKGVPRLLSGSDYMRTLRDIVEELMSLGKSRKFDDSLDEILAGIACHSVVRGAYSLSKPEITALLAKMDKTDFSGNCPHGRPVSRKITLGEIERMFKRG